MIVMGKRSADLSRLWESVIFTLPTGILDSGFADKIKRRREREKVCPPCPHRGGDVSSMINKN